MNLDKSDNLDGGNFGIYHFFLTLGCIPLIYWLFIGGISAILNSKYDNSSNQLPSSYGSINQGIHLTENIRDHSVFAKASSIAYFIGLVQIGLTIFTMLFSTIFNPKPHENTRAIIIAYTIYLGYWFFYMLFLRTYHTTTIFRSAYILFDFVGLGLSGILFFTIFVIINGIENGLIWSVYFAVFLAQAGLNSFIGLVDLYYLFQRLF